MILNYADHSANERTVLAWVRTVIAVEGFGLAAARLAPGAPAIWSEIDLLGAGAVVIALAFIRMRHIRGRIRSGESIEDDTLAADALLLALVWALFVLLAAFALHVS